MRERKTQKNVPMYLLSVLCAMAILFATTSGALALDYKQMFRQEGFSAWATWTEGSPDDYTETFLNVTKTNAGTDVYISIYADSGGTISTLTGYLYTTDKILITNGKLKRAVLSPVTVELYDSSVVPEPIPGPKPMLMEDITPIRTITIEAEWTGIGKAAKNSYRYHDNNGGFIAKYRSTSLHRQADVTGFLDDQDLGWADYGGMVSFRDASMQMGDYGTIPIVDAK